MIKTIADQYLAQNAGRRYPFRDDTKLPGWLTDVAVLDFRCTVRGVRAGTAPEARLTGVEHAQDGSATLTVTLTAGGEELDALQFHIPGDVAAKAPYTAYVTGERSYAALTVTAAALPPYDAEVECLRVDAAGPRIVIDGVTYCDAVGTYYAFTVLRDGVVTHDLIPVRRGNTGYMYDRITNKRFGNQGTGAFGYGDDVPMDVPFAATTVVCDSLKVDSLQSAQDADEALDEDDPDGTDATAALDGEIVLAEGRNADPYLDGNRLRLDIRKGAGLGEKCQSVSTGQTCDNVLFSINGERPGSDGELRIVGEDGITVTPRPEAHAVEVRIDDAALKRMSSDCRSTCKGG